MSSVVHSARRATAPGRHNHGEAFGLVRSDAASDALDLQILLVPVPYSLLPYFHGGDVVYAIAERAAFLLAA
jgi:hypothetical protein